MAPKNSKSLAAAAEKAKDVQETEDPLQAVVLLDSFETRFRPFTIDTPRCLLPLANVPLIEYTLEFLANSGIDEVYLYCSVHTDQVEHYIKRSKWMLSSSPFKVQLIRSTANTVGDAMRDLDEKNVLSGDFVIVYGDVVSNLSLQAVLREHRMRRATDKNAIMTMVLRDRGRSNASKSTTQDQPIFVLDPSKQRCLHYEHMNADTKHKRVEIDDNILSTASQIESRSDLVDCGIDICTPDVLALWSDNFDFKEPRRGFLHSVLKDYELNGKTIHTHIINDQYAARVRDLQDYGVISKDVLQRRVFPFSPDSNLYSDNTYSFQRYRIYREEGVKVSTSSCIRGYSAAGRGTRVGESTLISKSVIGRDCTISDSCTIESAYLWGNVTVGKGTTVKHSIIGSNVKIGEDCNISEGVLVGSDITIPAGTKLDKGERIVRKRKRGEVGYETLGSDSDDGDKAMNNTLYSLQALSLSQESVSTLHSDDDDDDFLEGETDYPDFARSMSVTSDDSGRGGGDSFLQDGAGSIYDSLQQGHDVTTIQLELQGLRMSANASQHQVRRAIAMGLVRYIADTREALKPIKGILLANKTLIERSIFDKTETTDQVDFLGLVQSELCKRLGGDAILLSICNDLYLIDSFEDDLFEVDAFKDWWDSEKSQSTDDMKKVRGKTERFIQVIDEDEDDDSE